MFLPDELKSHVEAALKLVPPGHKNAWVVVAQADQAQGRVLVARKWEGDWIVAGELVKVYHGDLTAQVFVAKSW